MKKSCTAPHATLKADRSLWITLPYAGGSSTPTLQVVPDDETGPGWITELRDCACGSTLGVVIVGESS